MSPEILEGNLSLTPAETAELNDLEARNQLLSKLDPEAKPLSENERTRMIALRQKAGPEKTMLSKLK